MYTCARSINFVSVSMIFLLDFGAVPTVWYFSIGFWNCSNSVVFFYWILERFQQCGIFLLDLELFQQCGIFLLDFGTVPTVWYFPIGFWNCSNSVVFSYWILELLRQCCIFLLDFGTVTTVWYFSI